jgi:ankyrin repeat protein
MATRNPHKKLIQFYRDNSEVVDIDNIYQIRYLFNGPLDMLKYIVENCDKKFDTNYLIVGMTPLILATCFCGFNAFKHVFDTDPSSINKFENNNMTAIVYAIRYSFKDKFDFLLEKGADLKIIHGAHKQLGFGMKNSLMHSSLGETDIYFLEKILELNIFNINERSSTGYTALFVAVHTNNYVNSEHVKLLLEAGASPNISNKIDDTPLMKAVSKKNFNIVKLLVEHGADIHAKRKEGDSVLELARKWKSPPQILDYLTKEDNWIRRRNFVIFLQCKNHSSISKIFALDKSNYMLHIIMSYI